MGRRFESYGDGLDLFDSDSAWRFGRVGYPPAVRLEPAAALCGVGFFRTKKSIRLVKTNLFTITSS